KTREPVDAPIQKLFWDVTDVAMQFPAGHVENRFNDFEKEILLPHRMSQLGPALAVADVNADGLEDFYCGGARDQSGSLYVQNEKGYFIPVPISAFDDFRSGEELGAIILDIDNDEVQELYVARGCGGDVAD